MHHFHVPDMTCGGCLRAIARALQSVDPQARVEGDLDTRTLKVTSDRSEDSLMLSRSNRVVGPLHLHRKLRTDVRSASPEVGMTGDGGIPRSRPGG